MAHRTPLAVMKWQPWRRAVATVFALVCPVLTSRAGTADFVDRYTVASLPPKPGAVLADATYGGVMDVVARPHALAVTWRLIAAPRRLRGLALCDNNDLLAVSLATGGVAHGLAIYRRVPAEHRWRGRWITSIDSGATPGEISFDDDGSDQLPGRHRLRCSRPGMGGFDGAVTITGSGADFLLTFHSDGTLLYRGAGILLDDGRLVVGWSFGSPPGLAAYRIGSDGLFTGRRVSLRGGQPSVVAEYLARAGDNAARLFPPAARMDPALMPSDVDASMEPDAPDVKTWVYDDLMDRYGSDGWAGRWLEGQLTPEEQALLRQAVRRRKGRANQGISPARPTIGDLIERERRRNDD